MGCLECGAENTRDRRFCAGCGAPLALACPDCGFQNQPDAKFCGGCGKPLAAPPAQAPGPAPPKGTDAGALGGERRQVAVLFVDLAGFTELSAALDAEDVHALVSRFFEAADGIVEHYGGTVDKHIGDAVMALFGAPVAHGDDAVRAVRAAFDIHKAMAAISEEAGRTLQVHAGIASGEVVAGGLGRENRQEYTVLGESVNLASRLDQLAGPGETLVADAVHRAVAGAVDCESIGRVQIKGLDKPVGAWRALRMRSRAAEATRGPFVGRRSELRQFAGVLDSCRESGAGQALLLRGEAGIGKTRLVEEFAAMAEGRGFAGHKALVLDFGVGRGQDAIRALVRSLLGTSAADDAERAAAVHRALDAGWLEPDQRVFLNDLLDLPQATEERSMYDAMDNATRNRGKQQAVAELIKAASADRPMLLIVEDVHWADSLTLGHLAAVTAAVRDCPTVVVMTTRVEGDPLDSAWRSTTRGSPLVTIDLGPLRKAEALALASRFMDATTRAALRCVERAEGNPLFLEQLLRNAEESEEAAVPASIQSLVLARMDRLPAADKQALQTASVIGQRFDLNTLRRLIEDPGYSCGGLIDHYLVHPEGEDYLFAHALIREGVYSSLLKSRRRELHRRAADWFGERDPVLYAEHLDRADDPVAPRAYLEAARAQAASHHYERAVHLVERGLALASLPADKFVLTCMKGHMLHDLGSIPESLQAYRQALEHAGNDAEQCQALIGLAAGMRITDEFDSAFDTLDEAESLARRASLERELAQIHHLRGNLHFPLGRMEACLEAHGKSLTHAQRAGSPEAEAEALGGLGDAEYAMGRMATAHDNFRRCVDLCRHHGFGQIEVANLAMLGHTALYLDGPISALEVSREAAAAAAKVGHHRAELNGRLSAFFSLAELDHRDDASLEIDRTEALIERLGARRFEATVLGWRARITLTCGQTAEAVALARRAFEVSRETGVGFEGPRILGTLALASPDGSERRWALSEAESILKAGAVGHNHLFFYRDAMEATLAEGHWEATERYAAALEEFTRPEPLPWSEFFIDRGRALAAWGRGRRDAELREDLRRLRDDGARVGIKTALPTLEAALAKE
ncbi:MAG: adenylate/guanylate cyclase domain-containing protein [Kiloniellaceae bacterium]